MASDLVRVTRGLTPVQVEAAYREGVFPMGDPDTDAISWHSPRRRAILPLDAFHISRSLARTLRQHRFEITFDRDFDAVVAGCADRPATWITPKIRAVYGQLHAQGKAHSVEIWQEGKLAGGIYGVHLGGAFFAESMFHRRTGMSKVALAELVARLCQRDFALLDVQYRTPHLARFGAVEVPGAEYRRLLESALALDRRFP